MYLMDTCAFIWYIETGSRLPKAVREIINNSENIYLSQATLWEIAIKQTIGKIDITMTSFELEDRCGKEKITILPLKCEYFERIKSLPLIHRDPFDRIIIATALEERLTLLTNDSNIIKYDGVKTLW
ncbi:MAG: type II toxin-antitoxin system VapC family toxin [Synergistaceae bacterium]|nr:type II toxin-antitoxin system VapC family toxin [Synergistaceae bacterium]